MLKSKLARRPRRARKSRRTEEILSTCAEPDEILIPDVRSGMTPAQMVDQKFLALSGSGSRSLQPVNRYAGKGAYDRQVERVFPLPTTSR